MTTDEKKTKKDYKFVYAIFICIWIVDILFAIQKDANIVLILELIIPLVFISFVFLFKMTESVLVYILLLLVLIVDVYITIQFSLEFNLIYFILNFMVLAVAISILVTDLFAKKDGNDKPIKA